MRHRITIRNFITTRTPSGQPTEEWSDGATIWAEVNPRTGNSDNTMKASNKRNAFYWRFVELGTSTAPAHPFVRPAFDTRMEEAAQVAMQRMNQAIDEVLAK
nr:HK97-gp10 family putative phage morphogenesis protein [Klebsiella variicola]